MKYTHNTIIWTADDEEPNCGFCDNQNCYGCCKACGAEFGWKYYEREENDSRLNKFASILYYNRGERK